MMLHHRMSFAKPRLAVSLISFSTAWAVAACVPPINHAPASGSCEVGSEGTLGIATASIELAPGESQQLPRPVIFVAPHVPPDTLATRCTVRWTASAGATIDQAGRITVNRDARPGSQIVVHARVNALAAHQQIQVVDGASNPLAATWGQQSPPMCANGERPADAIVRELVFRRGGTFAVTRVPFESYRDYWGTYLYDAVTTKLKLTVDGGNALPGFRFAEVSARVVVDQLTLDGLALAGELSNPARPGCRSVFTRLGAPR